MFRLSHIILTFFVGVCCEVYTALSNHPSEELTVESYQLRAADRDFVFSHQTDDFAFSAPLDMLSAECVSVFSARAPYGASVRSAEHSVRLRYVAKDDGFKLLAAESRPRHINKIFNFDIFRSSLRVDYYLHTHCRLRI